MSLATAAPQRAPTVYALPESAHIELVQMRNHLQLMAQLTELGSGAIGPDARLLRPEALGWWFSRLQRDIDGIISASSFCFEFAAAHAASCEPRRRQDRWMSAWAAQVRVREASHGRAR